MKKILCFGDSNTYGYIPNNGARYDKNTRWTGVLSLLLHGKFEIIEDGCNNRTAFAENPIGKIFTGYEILPELLTGDFDAVVLAIGINDTQFLYNLSSIEIASGVEKLINIVKVKSPQAKILLVAPSILTEDVLNGNFACLFDRTSIEKSRQLPLLYKIIAEKQNIEFLDLNSVAKTSSLDGLHYAPEQHLKIAQAIFTILSELF
ncbi:MAG: GDSL-type esterase/lipase family protein [Brachyspira sp.]|nr:GDSL-type esterase/lipase family protein [Brachyspira sp.]